MKLIVTTLIVALTASASWFALAQDGEEPRRGGRGQGGPGGGRGDFLQRLPVYKVLDKDANGELSEEEIKNATTALLTLDKNKDGKLSADEIAPSFDRRRFGGRRGDGERPQRPRRPQTEKSEPDEKKEDSDS